MRSFDQLGLEDFARFELGQFLEDRFRAAHFKRFWCLRETLKRHAEREREKDVPIHGSDGDTKSPRRCEA